MTHAHLNTLSQSQLGFEVGGSTQCNALLAMDIMQSHNLGTNKRLC
jgi:hypothetical protein